MKYVIDTSALIDWWVRFYPPESFPTLVTHMEALIAAGDLRSSRAVLDELERQDDDLARWAKAQQGFFIEDGEEVQDQVGYLVNKYYNEDKPEKGINGADPFVIGLAVTAGILAVDRRQRRECREQGKSQDPMGMQGRGRAPH